MAATGAATSLDNPILNGPFDAPERHFEIGPQGPTGIVVAGRRPSESWIPIPPVRKGATASTQQDALDFDATGERREPNPLINQVRAAVDTWRLRGYPGVTPTTRKLLEHWSDPARGDQRVLFCQREGAETAIYLAEVAGRHSQAGDRSSDFRRVLDATNTEYNTGLPRVGLKMATGAGKTVVMAMLIAWQSLNHAQSPRDVRFTDRFLVVTPGITIRDRLRVLQPSDSGSYYRERDLVPADLWGALRKARVSIVNYHAFLPRDRPEIKGVASRTRQILTQGESDPFKETDDDIVARVLKDLGLSARASGSSSGPRLMVLNDEAHHCYQDRPIDATQGSADAEAQDRNAQARVWFKGLRAIKRRVGIKQIYDLSATPFYLGGSGYSEGFIFPWSVCDFSLMDAIESGIVKVPRIPVDDDAAGANVTYLRLWDEIGKDLPRRRTANTSMTGLEWPMPTALEGALRSLYASYTKAWDHYDKELATHGEPPPVLIVVCPNTVVSQLVYEWIAGADIADAGSRPGNLALFSNVEDGRWLHRPRTLLIDSARLESGDALSDDFRAAAKHEIDAFTAEYRIRHPGADVERLTDEDLLREVLNTVGKPGRLGGEIRCVVSVAMLTEGWDANTVTHVLGIRAFGSQLLCEQVVGRGLRRRSYAVGEDGRFEAEYASVYGVPFMFISGTPGPEPKPQPPALHVQALPGRAHLRIEFARLDGYRLEIPDDQMYLDLDALEVFTIDPENVATWTQSQGVVGSAEEVDLRAELAAIRSQEVAYRIASQVVEHHLLAGADRRPWLFPRVVDMTRDWLDHKVDLPPGLGHGFLTLAQPRALAAEEVYRAIITQVDSRRERLRPVLRGFDPTGSTAGVSFVTRKHAIPTEKSEVSHVVLDGPGGNTWEQILAAECERHPDVAAYVKNDHLGFVIPYVHKGVTHGYVPDFLLRLRPIDGDPAGTRTLIVEVSGGQKSPGPTKAKAATARQQWCPAVNNHGGFGRWGYVEVTDMPTVREVLDDAIARLYADDMIDPDLLDAHLPASIGMLATSGGG